MAPKQRLTPAAQLQGTVPDGLQEPAWVGSWGMGSGAFGSAHLWIKQDAGGLISDRLIIKDSYVTPQSWHTAERAQDLWSNDPADATRKIPNEVLAMYLLRGKKGSDNVVRVRSWRIWAEAYMHRIYMEFCECGDAFSLVKNYMPGRNIANLEMDTGEKPFKVPEPFLWYLLDCLATAGSLMQDGELDNNPHSGWTPIIHRDLKTENVFLAWPSEDKFRGYPTAKLGDFGFAKFTKPGDNALGPTDFPVRGTQGCHTPEQTQHTFPGESGPRQMDEKTNVWGVGHIVWEMIMVVVDWNAAAVDYNRAPSLLLTPRFYDDGWEYELYSGDLLGLIQRCMSYKPEDRPTFKTILRAVKRFTGSGTTDHAKGLRSADRSHQGWRDEGLAPDWVNEYGDTMMHLGQPLQGVALLNGMARWPQPPAARGSNSSNGDGLGDGAGTAIKLPPRRRGAAAATAAGRSGPPPVVPGPAPPPAAVAPVPPVTPSGSQAGAGARNVAGTKRLRSQDGESADALEAPPATRRAGSVRSPGRVSSG